MFEPEFLTKTTETIYTVSQLNQTARMLLEENFPLLWVEGEISNLARPSSGHMYFSLKDAQCQVRCAMFSGRNRNLRFQPENGLQVLVRARVSLYEGRGEFQLIVEQMEPAGDGLLQRAFEELKQRLAKEGLFAEEHKKPLPVLPRAIGVVTSPTGAAIRDILSVLRRRFPAIPVIIYPTAVQGNEAAPQIVKAIRIANQRRECDVLIVARGGGSLEDLWPFNEEAVARAIYASEIPIVSGVGHEIDFTIADFVADQRAPTPSAAAELVSPDQHKWLHDLMSWQRRLTHQIELLLERWQHQLNYLSHRLRHPGQYLQEQSQRLDYLERNLSRSMLAIMNKYYAQLSELSRALDAISPLATLQRGYAIVTDKRSEKIIYSADQVKEGDQISARLKQGSLECIVVKVAD